jgi:Ulp1 family protease
VRRWTRPRRTVVDIFAKRALLFPINIENRHWVFAYVDITFKKIVM